MSFFVLPTPSPRPKNKYIPYASLTLAAIIVIMVVAQLFTYERFADVIAALGFERSTGIAATAVVLEVASLPFLLLMPLSPAARIGSMIAGWLVVLGWLVASLLNTTLQGEHNSGLLGATVDVPVGWWCILFVLGIAALCAWVSWGMWPRKSRRRS